jgi:hypothetical protein
MEGWTSVPIGSLCNRMKQLGCHTTTGQTIGVHDALKRGVFASLGENVRERGQVSIACMGWG